MAYVQQDEANLKALDPEDIGWWIESVDERRYGPVSRKTLRRFLEEGHVSLNTLVRHCAQAEARPVADQPSMVEGLKLPGGVPASGDRLAEVWPRRARDQLALAEDSFPCWRHKRPAVAVCVRCQAPYCDRCRAKPKRRAFFYCHSCQANSHNRRFGALIIDIALFNYGPILLVVPLLATAASEALLYLAQALGGILLLLRDSLFRGAGPGKRIFGLRVVDSRDGITPVGYGQGIVRWLSQFIPIFNLVDALAPRGDPLQRRYGDRWAKTRVIDSSGKLNKARRRVRQRLAKKGVMLAKEPLPMEDFARLG